MSSLRLSLGVGLCVCVSFALLSSAPVRAQSASDAAAARTLFTEGVARADAGDWSAAIDRFERALALRGSAVIEYNLAVALDHAGRHVEAGEHFRRVVRDREAEPELRAAAEGGLREAEAEVGFLAIAWDGPTAGATLRVDGAERPLALLGTRMPVDRGVHTVELRDARGPLANGRATVGGGEETRLSLRAVPRPPAEPPPPIDEELEVETAAEPAHGDDAPWIALGIGGGVLLVAGVVVLTVVLVPGPEQASFPGSLGTVELGR